MLKLKNLKIGYQEALAYSPFDLEIESNQLIVLLGRNGSGKTTLLRTLAQLLPAKRGQIYFGQQPLEDYSPQDLARLVSIVTTERVQIPYLRVWELIALGRLPYLNFGGKIQPNDQMVINEVIDLMGIASLRDKYINQCSDGERQLVMLARALVQDTPLVLLDELTVHLDFVNRVKLFKLVRQLSRKKLFILATHEIELALKVADKVLLLQPPTFFYGTPAQLIESGQLNQAFADEAIRYNAKQQRFDIDFE